MFLVYRNGDFFSALYSRALVQHSIALVTRCANERQALSFILLFLDNFFFIRSMQRISVVCRAFPCCLPHSIDGVFDGVRCGCCCSSYKNTTVCVYFHFIIVVCLFPLFYRSNLSALSSSNAVCNIQREKKRKKGRERERDIETTMLAYFNIVICLTMN